jgi:PAS domain S-box-containing protein
VSQMPNTFVEGNSKDLVPEITTGMVLQFADSTIAACDAGAERIFGCTAAQLIGKTSSDLGWQMIREDGSVFPSQEYPGIIALRTCQPCYNVIMGFYRANGELVWLSLNSNPLFQANSTQPYAVVTTLSEIPSPLIKQNRQSDTAQVRTVEPTPRLDTDIAEPKRMEEALRESEDRLRMAIDSAGLGTWDWNLVTGELKWNTACKALFGLPPDAEVSIEVFFEGLHPDDRNRLEEIVQWALNPASNGFYAVEYRTVGIKDGIERWIAAQGQAYFSSEREAVRFIGTVFDITARKQAEARREQLLQREQAAREQAETANRIKDEFLAMLSHELRTPLNPILGWVKLLQQRKLDETKTREALATIERNAKLQAQLIEDLLDISRIMRGKLSLNVEPVNLTFIVSAAQETVRLAAETKNIQLHVSSVPYIREVFGDPTRLQQVVWNLLSNAIKFTPPGGRVEVELTQVGTQAQIQVRDTGRGINPEFLPYVFEYFRQEDGSTTRKFGGLGLGLAISRQIVEMHGGTIWADSPGEGKGATFTVWLPSFIVELVQSTNPTFPTSS